jgi:hypothetical protein
MQDVFSQLMEDSDGHSCRALGGHVIVRPKPGYESPFQQIAARAVSEAGERYGVLAEIGSDGRYASLTLITLV